MTGDSFIFHTLTKLGTLPAVGLGKVYRNLEFYHLGADGFKVLKPTALLDLDDGLGLKLPISPTSLHRQWLNGSPQELWSVLILFIKAAIGWKAHGFPSRPLDPRGFFTTDQGEFFLVPPQTMDYLTTCFPESDKESFSPLVHPDRTGELSWTFFLSVMIFRIFKDSWPWEGSEETVHQLIRERKLPSCRFIIPGIDPELGKVVDRGFLGELGFGELGQWRDVCSSREWKDLKQELTTDEEQKALREGQSQLAKTERRWRIKDWVRRQRLALILSGAALVFLFIIFGVPALQGAPYDPWKDALPEVLTKTYYEAINTLEDRGLEKMKGPKLHSSEYDGDVKETSYLKIFNEGRKMTLGDSGLISAQEWTDQGRPPLARGLNLYGVCGVEIQALDEDSFQISYEKWTTSDQGDKKSWQAWAVTDRMDFFLTPNGYRLQNLTRQTHILATGR